MKSLLLLIAIFSIIEASEEPIMFADGYTITPPSSWSQMESPNPSITLIANQTTREACIITILPNPGSINIANVDMLENVKTEFQKVDPNAEVTRLFQRGEGNHIYKIFSTKFSKTPDQTNHMIIFSDSSHIYRLIINLKNDSAANISLFISNIKKTN